MPVSADNFTIMFSNVLGKGRYLVLEGGDIHSITTINVTVARGRMMCWGAMKLVTHNY